MDKDSHKKYSGRLTVKSVDRAITALVDKGSRNSVRMLQVLLDVIRHQGDSPANISDRLMNERDSSTIQGMLNKMDSWGWLEMVDAQYQAGESPRKQVFITRSAAELLQLNTPESD